MAQPQQQPTSGTVLSNTVVLKKYGNRRLYDTNASRYVTLDEVEQMVQRGMDIQVVDAKTHEDLTKEILVQIILDKDVAKEMLPTGFLKQVVRLSSSPLKESFTRALQDSLDGFLQTQRALLDAQRSMIQQLPAAFNPMNAMGAMGNVNAWNPFAPPAPQIGAPPAAPAHDPEIDRLRAEMGQMHAMLQKLVDKDEKPRKRARR